MIEVNQIRVTCCSLQRTSLVLLRFYQRFGSVRCEAGALERSHSVPTALQFWDRCQAAVLLFLVTIRAASSQGAVARGNALACSYKTLPATVSYIPWCSLASSEEYCKVE